MSSRTPYAKKLASASFANARIERLFILEGLRQVVRISDCRGAHHTAAGVVIPEDELLILLGDAIAARVFSPTFLAELAGIVKVGQ